MPLKLMYITNDITVADIAQESGVDRIWIDLEWMGKEKRQYGMDTVKSKHTIDDIAKLRPHIKKSELMVRVNPLYDDSKNEIEEVAKYGADLIMLPMLKTADDVKCFVECVDHRARVMLLVETAEAVNNLKEIVRVQGIDEIHIGLNDLHISYGMSFMFELVANGVIDNVCNIIKDTDIPYGFGGVAKIGEGILPAEYVLGEHYRLGSSMVILSRSFCNIDTDNNIDTIRKTFNYGVEKIRNYERFLAEQEKQFFIDNHIKVQQCVNNILLKKKEKV